MIVNEEIGVKVRMGRLRFDLRQDELAKKAGISRQTVWRIESGQCGSVSFDSVVRVLSAVGYGVYLDQGTVPAEAQTSVSPAEIERLYDAQVLGRAEGA